jgi:hypothetical protein
VFPGNSGGPVFVAKTPKADAGVQQASTGGDVTPTDGFIAGLLTQQVELNNERLEIGIVTHAKYVRETIALLANPLADTTVASGGAVTGGRVAADGGGAPAGGRAVTAEEAARD